MHRLFGKLQQTMLVVCPLFIRLRLQRVQCARRSLCSFQRTGTAPEAGLSPGYFGCDARSRVVRAAQSGRRSCSLKTKQCRSTRRPRGASL